MADSYDYFVTASSDLTTGMTFTNGGTSFTITTYFNMPSSSLSLFNATINSGSISPNTFYDGPVAIFKTGLFTTKIEIFILCTENGSPLLSVSGIGTHVGVGYYQSFLDNPYTGTLTPAKTGYEFTPSSFVFNNQTQSVVDSTVGALALPGKATTPAPTDDQEDIEITGKDNIKQLTWVTPDGETPDFLIYFRAQGGAWVLQETITDNSTSHTLSSTVLDTFSYYSIYEWRVDTRNDGGTTTGDTWTFISQKSTQFTDYTRRSDYDADKVWQPGTGWVDIDSFEYTGGGRFKGRVLVIGHQVLYFGDI